MHTSCHWGLRLTLCQMVGTIAIAMVLNIQDPNHLKPNFKMFGFQIGLVSERSEFEPPLYLQNWNWNDRLPDLSALFWGVRPQRGQSDLERGQCWRRRRGCWSLAAGSHELQQIRRKKSGPWKKIQNLFRCKTNKLVMRPLCLVESQTLDAA